MSLPGPRAPMPVAPSVQAPPRDAPAARLASASSGAVSVVWPASAAKDRPRDAFPHTRRPLPWALAAFVAMLFLIPIDSTELKVHLPVDSHIDRFAVVALLLLWICVGGDQRAIMRTRRSKLYAGAVCAFVVLAVASLLLDSVRIVNVSEVHLAAKRFALFGGFIAVSWFTLTALRFEDLRGFASYLIGLASVMAVGMLIERHTGSNLFFEATSTLLKPIASVAPPLTDIHPAYGSDGRVTVVGPTIHGLAATTMLMVAMPFALVRFFDARSLRSRALNALAFALMLAGAAATDRKTALLVPVAVVLYFAIYRPRQVLRLAPLGAVLLLLLIHLSSPGAIGSLLSPTSGFESSSTQHRISDFEDVTPDVLAHPLLGRGFGTLDPEQTNVFRINDDEYVDEIWEVGAIGLAAYLFMILAPVVVVRRAIRSRDPAVAPLALAASAGCVAYFVANALFDAMSFPQAPYVFFVVAALSIIAAAGPEGNVVPVRQERLRYAALRGIRGSAVSANDAAIGQGAAITSNRP